MKESILDSIVLNRRIIVCVGSGGVGKTTTSAALALRAAHHGRRAIVLTVDPARRLANALGMASMPNNPVQVDLAEEVQGSLWALMLDARSTFDEVIRRHAPSEKARNRILTNPFYDKATATLAGTHEYMAMEQLLMLHESDDFDCLILDTPPSTHAVDFLNAPRRLTAFMNKGTTRIFLKAARAMSSPLSLFALDGVIVKGISIFVGSGFFRDLLSFIQSFEGMFDSFNHRAEQTQKLLRSDETGFVIVHVPEPNSVEEASNFDSLLREEGMNLDAYLANRVHPPPAFDEARGWTEIRGTLDGFKDSREITDHDIETIEKQGKALLENLKLLSIKDRDALKKVESIAQSRNVPAPLIRVPHFDEDLHDIHGLHRFANHAALSLF